MVNSQNKNMENMEMTNKVKNERGNFDVLISITTYFKLDSFFLVGKSACGNFGILLARATSLDTRLIGSIRAVEFVCLIHTITIGYLTFEMDLKPALFTY